MSFVSGGSALTVLDPVDENSLPIALGYHQELHRLKLRYEELYLEFAKALFHVMEMKTYLLIKNAKGERYSTFEQYTQEEFGFGERKARKLRDIYWWFYVANDSPELIDGLKRFGWTKAYELVGVVDDSTAEKWFGMAERLTTEELKIARRAARKKQAALPTPPKATGFREFGESAKAAAAPAKGKKPAEEPDASAVPPIRRGEEKAPSVPVPTELEIEEEKKLSGDWQTITYRIMREWRPLITAAFEAARKLSDNRAVHDGYLLELICTQFLAGAGVELVFQREELLTNLERSLGVTLVAIEEPSGRIVFGEDSIRRITGVRPERPVIDGEGKVVGVDVD